MTRGLKGLAELLSLYFHGFTPVEFVRGKDRITQHASGWRVNGSGHLERAKDAMALVEQAPAEEWRQVYCGINLFLVSDRGEVKKHDGTPADTVYLNGRCQIKYQVVKYGRLRDREIYRSHLVAMAFLNYQRGDEREIHHINGYRNDDSVANLVVLSREDHAKVHSFGPTAPTGPVEPDMPLPRQRAKKAEKQQRQGKHAGAPVGLSYAASQPASVAVPSVEGEGEAPAEQRSGGKRRRGKSTAKRRSDQRRAEEQAAKESAVVETAAAKTARAVEMADVDVEVAPQVQPAADTTDDRADVPAISQPSTERAAETREVSKERDDVHVEAAAEEASAAVPEADDEPAKHGDAPEASDDTAERRDVVNATDDAAEAGSTSPEAASEADGAVEAPAVSEEAAGSDAAEEGGDKPRRRRGRRGGRRHRRKAEASASPADERAVEQPVMRAEEPEEPIASVDEPEEPSELAVEADQPAVVELEAPVVPAEADMTVALTPAEEPRVFETEGSADEPEDFPLPTDVVVEDEPVEAVVVAEAPSDEWEERRAAFDRELEQFLAGFAASRQDEAGEAAQRARGRQVRHVYRALRPFHGCDDAVMVFDTALSALRRINQFATDRDEQTPGVVVGVLSQANQMLKGACARLAESDDVARACTIELLEEEAQAVVYRRLGYDVKLRKHVKLLEEAGAQGEDSAQEPSKRAEHAGESADATECGSVAAAADGGAVAHEPAAAEHAESAVEANDSTPVSLDAPDVPAEPVAAPAAPEGPVAKRPSRRSRRRRPGKRERARRPLPGPPNELR